MTNRIILLFGLLVCAGVVHADPLGGGDPEAGKQVAGACAACHGPQGNMESPQFPKLAGQGAPYLHEQLMLFKSGERENAIMAGQAAGLDDKAMQDVAAYFAAQTTRPGAADESIAPAGAKLYHGGAPDKSIPACSGCHGPSGLGNPAAKYPRISGQSPAYIAAQLTAYRDGTRAGYANAKTMAGVASRLSETEIKSLASYVAGLAPAGKDAGNDKGALMQKVAGPAAAGGAQSAGADGGQKPAAGAAEADNADTSGGDEEKGKSDAPTDDSNAQDNTTATESKAAAPSDADQNSSAPADAGDNNSQTGTNPDKAKTDGNNGQSDDGANSTPEPEGDDDDGTDNTDAPDVDSDSDDSANAKQPPADKADGSNP